MRGRVLLFCLALAGSVALADDSSVLRGREQELADAIRAKNENALLDLTEQNFRSSWSRSVLEGTATSELDRNGWIASILRRPIDSYAIVISSIDVTRPDFATVSLVEKWRLELPGGSSLERHFSTVDLWRKEQGVWKLQARFSNVTEAGAHLKYPGYFFPTGVPSSSFAWSTTASISR